LLITGVTSAANLSAIGRLGGRTLLIFGSLLSGVALVMVPLASLAFDLLPGNLAAQPPLPAGAAQYAGEIAANSQPADFSTWFTSLLPTNPIAAAANGAMLQLILFTLLLALAIVRTSPAARDTLVGFFRALGEAMMVMVGWIVKLAPFGVFALILSLTAHTGMKMAGAAGFYIAVYSIACLLVTLLLYPVVSGFTGISIRRYARAALPAQLIGFSSSSSLAALPALIETADHNLRLPTRVTGFVLPLAASAFKIAAPVSWPIGTLFVAWFYGVDLHATQVATVALAAVLVGFAAPGVPHGAFLLLAPLFLTIGLPAEGVGILIAVDAIPDLFSSVLNVTGNLTATTLASGRVSATDRP
jgi:Na+/H+-dicarboxylate symporter